MSDTLSEIRAAVAALGDKRRIFAGVLCEHRDRYVAEGNLEMAELWNLLSCLAHETLAEERATLRTVEDIYSLPVVEEPPC